MKTLEGFPYFEIEFTKEGRVYEPLAVSNMLHLLTNHQITDLMVISHGWNNDMQEARELYKNLTGLVSFEIHQRDELSDRKFAVIGVLWPSKKFANEDLIPAGGAASIDLNDNISELKTRLEEMQSFFDGDDSETIIKDVKEEASRLDTDPDAPVRYVSLLQRLIAQISTPHMTEPEDYAADSINTENTLALLTRLSDIRIAEPILTREGAANIDTALESPVSEIGIAAGISFSWDGLLNGARNLLNFVTYYQMKERAGKIGIQGLYPLLLQIKNILPACRLHLIGHSFGGRVVTAAVAGPTNDTSLIVDTLTLLQAAFSHYGFAENYDREKGGVFRNVISKHKVKGPILISFTHNDKAVRIAYAIASRIARQAGEFLGDKGDYFGGMGANGAQKTANVSEVFKLDKEALYTFQAGSLYNLNADNCITGHSDICQPEVAKAIVSAITIT